jgi:adenosine deaminase
MDPMSPEDIAAIESLPKVELHCHLEGSVPADTFIALAGSHGLTIPTGDPAHVYDFTSFLGFLDLYGLVCASMVTAADFERATYDSLAWAARCGIIYREVFWNVTNHDGVTYRTQLDGIAAGIAAAKVDHGIECRMLPAINRRHSPQVANELVDAVIAHPHELVVGISMDDDEASGPPEMFVEAYRRAGAAGLHRTAHAGELGSADNVRTSLELLGCERIDHGYGMVNDAALMAQVCDSGVHVTGAWFVNQFHAGVFTSGIDPADTPLAHMLRAGVNCSINTDDPTMIPTTISAEMVGAMTASGLGAQGARTATLAAIEAAWIDDALKATLRAKVLG